MPKRFSFKATIEKAGGGGAFVVFPYDAIEVFGKGRVPIRAMIDQAEYRGSLVKYASPEWMLLIRKDIREKISKKIGDEVNVVIEEDLEERTIELPAVLQKRLAKEKLLKKFEACSFTQRREWATGIELAKREETRESRLEKIVAALKEKPFSK